MTSCLRVVTAMLFVPYIYSHSRIVSNFLTSHQNKSSNNFSQLLRDIQRERPYDTMVIMQQNNSDLRQFDELLQFPAIKILLTTGHAFAYYAKFNWEVLVIIYMSHKLDYQLMQTAAITLDFMRQSRIIVRATDIKQQDTFKYELIQVCEKYKMTNVLVDFYDNDEKTQTLRYLQLKPYPLYHWLPVFAIEQEHEFFPLHWLNMHNKTLITYTDQNLPRVLLSQDPQGNFKLNGYVARLIELFADYYNASLQLYRPLKLGNVFHFTILLQLTKDGKLDLPMAMDTGTEVAYITYPFDVAKGMIMVPCALRRTTQQIFGLLLEIKFLVCIASCALILSVAHSLIDWFFLNVKECLNFVIHDHVVPGILGLPFAVRASHMTILRIVYFLVGFVGTYIAALFSGQLNTLLTSPPLDRQIATFDDLSQSPLKILLDANEAKFMMHLLEPIKNSLILSPNTTQVMSHRHSFNTTYGYYVSSTVWNFYTQWQQFFNQQLFCIPKGLLIHDLSPFGLRLQYNSPYKDAMNRLIHRVHASGLVDAWHSSTFVDMLKTKKFTIKEPDLKENWKTLNAYDLLWIWMTVIVGLTSSMLAFLVELTLGKWRNRMQIAK